MKILMRTVGGRREKRMESGWKAVGPSPVPYWAHKRLLNSVAQITRRFLNGWVSVDGVWMENQVAVDALLDGSFASGSRHWPRTVHWVWVL